jgi:parallel beta-helix repeat protein/predicted outer membrane repeat protein
MRIDMLCRLTAIILSCTLYATPVTAKTWHVPGDAATIKGGIGLASAGDTVLVACGTYYEHDIRMKSGVCLRSETGDASCVTIDAQQQDRVIYCRFVTSAARIEGFTITGGLATEGGGLYCLDNSSPSVKNCVISGNSASDWGGGVYCNVNSSPTFVNCTFAGNSASGGGGGGMYCLANSSPTLTDCSLSGNSGTVGGGMHCYHFCSPTFTNCTFSDNVADYGGGMNVSLDCAATLTNCTFSGNSTQTRGGGMRFAFGGSATLNDCTFSGNTAHSGGGICFESDGSTTLINCSLTGNSATYGGAMKIECNGGCASVTLMGCSLTDNSAQDGGGICMEGASYFAADTTEFHNNTASNEGAHGYVESEGEAVLTCCVSDLTGFAGDGIITLNNDGCFSPTKTMTWGRLKAFYR